MSIATKAVLFDIDGTILKCNGAGKQSLLEATEQIFNTTGNMQQLNFQGKTDMWILHQSLLQFGISEKDIQHNIEKLKKTYFNLLKSNLQNSNAHLLKGIKEIIETMHNQPKIKLGLLTGNFETSAFIKIGYFNLQDYFQFGAFGDDSEDRNNLPEVARQKFKSITRDEIDFSDIVIIGDTIHDIACAQHVNAKSIAVATGWTPKQKLENHKPDLCLDDLSNIDKIINFIL